MVGAESSLFLELGLVVIIASLAGLIFKLLRQPQILAYVLVGIFKRPILEYLNLLLTKISGLGLIGTQLPTITTDVAIIGPMATIGIAFLLFIVGLEMDLKALRSVTLVSTVGGAIQIIIMFIFGYLAAIFMGFLSLEASYVGLMLAFSSTMVAMKLLSDKRELNTLHGRLAIGILLMQDIVAIFALSILSSAEGFSASVLGIALVKFLAIFAVAYLLSKFIFPRVFKFAAHHQELLLMSSLAVCFIFSLAFHYLGFSIAIGAFLAGLTLGNLEYNVQIIGKTKSLKDFVRCD